MHNFLESTTICGLRNLSDPAGHTHVLSLIDPEWTEPTEFATWQADRWRLLRFHDDIEQRDQRVSPTREHVAEILAFGKQASEDPASRLFIHCLSGKSRSTAAAVLIWSQAFPQHDEQYIMGHLLRVRPQAWPNLLMIQYGDELLGRDGKLVSAAHELYKQGLIADPDWARTLERLGRTAEIIR
ncbi:tyrosine phosphatase family protein [Paraburkholderia metrosideri]|uniref:Protein tyrosine phosphatase n=1 Tax=Paraburkholderia metrosideri TaxID=580937 RepID=A0ABM8P2Z5_9BURK|nr:hypothetical protein [Paraburkholderia metrosideri]CAD6554806.1 hypothetical protein LMG28140_05537 [Paraburkholderia metrosideri]